MKLYRIKDTSEKAVNELIQGEEIASIEVEIQGYNKPVEITLDNIVKFVAIDGVDYEFEKPTFLVNTTQKYDDIESYELVNVKKSDLIESKKNGYKIPCKFNGMKAFYNAQNKVCEVIFEGMLYIA